MKPDLQECAPLHGKRLSQVVVIVPTYNEIDNVASIVGRLVDAHPEVDILIVDDASPDGTGELADRLAVSDPERIFVMHRVGKDGLGAAYLAGFAWALERSYRFIVEMDADGSHPPEQLHRLLGVVDDGADVCIGSRYVPGGEVRNWPRRREVLSRSANQYARLMLGTDVRDITAGFRIYRSEVLRTIGLDDVASKGYCFQVDLTWRSLCQGFRVVEVPITFCRTRTWCFQNEWQQRLGSRGVGNPLGHVASPRAAQAAVGHRDEPRPCRDRSR